MSNKQLVKYRRNQIQIQSMNTGNMA